MYGLLLENIAAFVKIQWGEGKWESVRRKAGIDAPSFSIHHVYAETLMSRLSRTAIQVLGVDEREFFESMGVYFVEFVGQYGYDKVLTVLGRHLRDFLNGLDNLHEYLKFSYPKMRAPSFFCDNETESGLQLHYRSKRRGFVYYTMGQIRQVAKHFYDQECKIKILSEELDGDTMHVIYHLAFNNQAFVDAQEMLSMIRREQQLPIRASLIFELFPFSVAFNVNMEITYTGHALLTIIRGLVGQCMTEAFDLTRPLIPFCFQTIIERSNNIFELVTVAPIKADEVLKGSLDLDEEDEEGVGLRLRGQMLYMEEWSMLLYLAMPVMPDIDCLVESGLFINDLALHDCSRDLVLAGTQQSVELRLALDQEQQKSKKLEDSMKKLDAEMKRTDDLLYQMIPKQVADRIRRGENPVDTCEVFEAVSVLFSDVVTFTDICSRITPMQVVGMLNHMYSLFDQLTERNGVYKVETIGDAYMVVSGAPTVDAHHAERICDMALDMVDASQAIKDPSKGEDQEHLKLRVGCHSGMVVAGVVGLKMPRYCLFGDTVNTASRMESTGIGGQIQISESTKNLIPSVYKVEKRGTVAVKGKGEMNTYWLNSRDDRVALQNLTCNTFVWTAPTVATTVIIGGKPPEESTDTLVEDTKAVATNIVKDEAKVESEDKSEKSSNSISSPTTSNVGGTNDLLLNRQNSVDKVNLDSLRKAVTKTSILNTFEESVKAKPESSPAITPTPIKVPEKSEMKFSNARLILADAESSPFRPRSKSISKLSLVVPSGSRPSSPSILSTLKVPKTGITYNQTPVRRRSDVSESSQGTPTLKVQQSSEPPGTPSRRPLSSPRNRVKKVLSQSPSKLRAIQRAEAENGNIVVTITSNINESSKPFPEDNPTLPTVQNQTQENFLITKATLNNSSNLNGNPSNNDIKNDVNPNGRRDPLINRLRKNKVALLTSEAMAQMGCSGFRARQKEVVTQTCNLL